MFDGVKQVLPGRELNERRVQQRPVQQAGATRVITGADHKHVGDDILFGCGAQCRHKAQRPDDDLLPFDLALMWLHLHGCGDVAKALAVDAVLVLNLPLQGLQG